MEGRREGVLSFICVPRFQPNNNLHQKKTKKKHKKTSDEDMWPVYNLVRPGDTVTATTFRKVAAPGGGSNADAAGGGDRGGGGGSERLKLKLSVTASAVDYDPVAATVRVSGPVCSECPHVRLGAHHTLELAPHRAFSLSKPGPWDRLDTAALAAATNPAASADLAACLIDVSGAASATLALVGGSTTTIRARLEAALPKKKGAAAAHGAHDKALSAFYDKVASAIARHVDWDVVRCLVIAGPGFGKDGLLARLRSAAAGGGGNTADKALSAALKDRVITAHASSAYRHALREVLADPAVAARIADTKAARESAALAAFFEALHTDPDRAWYGPAHVAAAADAGAVATLLLSDSVVRAANPAARRAYAALADGVRAGGGVVHTLSGAHVSGEQLDQVTGVAALLRFPMPELDEVDVDAGLPGVGGGGGGGGG
jgi:protein pelota